MPSAPVFPNAAIRDERYFPGGNMSFSAPRQAAAPRMANTPNISMPAAPYMFQPYANIGREHYAGAELNRQKVASFNDWYGGLSPEQRTQFQPTKDQYNGSTGFKGEKFFDQGVHDWYTKQNARKHWEGTLGGNAMNPQGLDTRMGPQTPGTPQNQTNLLPDITPETRSNIGNYQTQFDQARDYRALGNSGIPFSEYQRGIAEQGVQNQMTTEKMLQQRLNDEAMAKRNATYDANNELTKAKTATEIAKGQRAPQDEIDKALKPVTARAEKAESELRVLQASQKAANAPVKPTEDEKAMLNAWHSAKSKFYSEDGEDPGTWEEFRGKHTKAGAGPTTQPANTGVSAKATGPGIHNGVVDTMEFVPGRDDTGVPTTQELRPGRDYDKEPGDRLGATMLSGRSDQQGDWHVSPDKKQAVLALPNGNQDNFEWEDGAWSYRGSQKQPRNTQSTTPPGTGNNIQMSKSGRPMVNIDGQWHYAEEMLAAQNPEMSHAFRPPPPTTMQQLGSAASRLYNDPYGTQRPRGNPGPGVSARAASQPGVYGQVSQSPPLPMGVSAAATPVNPAGVSAYARPRSPGVRASTVPILQIQPPNGR